MFKEVMYDLWLARISSLSNEVGLYVILQTHCQQNKKIKGADQILPEVYGTTLNVFSFLYYR